MTRVTSATLRKRLLIYETYIFNVDIYHEKKSNVVCSECKDADVDDMP